MTQPPRTAFPRMSDLHLLKTYVADLELEVDRLRKHGQLVQHEARAALKRIHALCVNRPTAETPTPLEAIEQTAQNLAEVLRDLQDPPGYHPAHDQVIAVALRPLAEQVFRWQQRLVGASGVALQFLSEDAHLEWFPARLRHILDNLFSNALKYRDPDKTESWVRLDVQTTPRSYTLLVSDNGLGLPAGDQAEVFELFYRAGPTRVAGLGVGLAVVKLLVEQSGGTLGVASGEGQGSTFTVVLPRYDVDDYLT